MQQNSDDDLDHSPFRGQQKKSLSAISNRIGQNINHPHQQQHTDISPLKGRLDPNMASYARQNAHLKQP